MNKSQNPTAVQSKIWIMDSLISIMETKDFKEISISEISDRAGLVRRTFYRNFSSKEDVLQSYFNSLVDEFVRRISLYKTLDCNESLRELLKICKEHKDFFQGLKRSNMLGFMLEQWNLVLPKIHAQMLDKIRHFPQSKSEKSLEYLLAFNVGGTFNMVMKWIHEDMAISPDELADIVEEFSGGSLITKEG
ncbi:MAG: TetR/AcrR family transcriptional regulator [Lachnospiraceae bacterium]|nr:TetR/AcrR family transcriptional regulator [Lachnospiraceae bacterium]